MRMSVDHGRYGLSVCCDVWIFETISNDVSSTVESRRAPRRVSELVSSSRKSTVRHSVGRCPSEVRSKSTFANLRQCLRRGVCECARESFKQACATTDRTACCGRCKGITTGLRQSHCKPPQMYSETAMIGSPHSSVDSM